MASRKKGLHKDHAPWRTSEQRGVDGVLRGTWWRCRVHGLTQDPIILGSVAYCAADPCDEKAALVSSAIHEGVDAGFEFNTFSYSPEGDERQKRARDRSHRPSRRHGRRSNAEMDAARAFVLRHFEPGATVPRAVLVAAWRALPAVARDETPLDNAVASLITSGRLARAGFGLYAMPAPTSTHLEAGVHA